MSETAITIGKFDGFHIGHQALLRDIISVSRAKGYEAACFKIRTSSKSIMSEEEDRLFFRELYPDIRNIIFQDFTKQFSQMTAEDFVRDYLVDRLKVRYIAVGRDFRFGRDRAGDVTTLTELGQRYGYEVNVIDKVIMDGSRVSSSLVRQCLESGDVERAAKYLGRPYRLTGKVAGGKRLGRALGYPTINLQYSDGKTLPLFGVYSSEVLIYNRESERCDRYSGITNIGIRPSINDGMTPTIETFIYDFDGDIYGSTVSILPQSYIRGEIHFDSLDELTKQIASDIQTAKHRGDTHQ